jgi:N-acetylglucosaminyldiphosphoundecaprenol N-acetyl-beta-D-mannosaminyltransferase
MLVRTLHTVHILGCKVHRLDMETTLAAILEFVKSGQGHIIVTADSYGITLAQQDEEFRRIINDADLVTPDSTGVLLGSRFAGDALPFRVTGCDVAQRMCEMAARESFRVYLLGAKPGVAQQAADKLVEHYPGLQIAGCRDGYFQDGESEAVAADVRASRANALLVGLGIPRQEKWIKRHLAGTGVQVAMGVGGSFDVISGNIKRAPEWMQRHGLEWAYRFAKDPSKIYKLVVLPKFLFVVMWDRLFVRRNKNG